MDVRQITGGNKIYPTGTARFHPKEGIQAKGKPVKESIDNLSGTKQKVKVNYALDKLKSAAFIFNKRLDFEIHEATHRIMVKVIDQDTDKVIKEIPPKQILDLAAKLQEMIGILLDEDR